MTIRPRRSVLYMPASNARAIEKARTLPVDAVILDLEDSVAPEGKAAARQQMFDAVTTGAFGAREVIVRINGLETEWWLDDLNAVAKAKPDAVLVPKVSSPNHLEDVGERLVDISADQKIRVWAMMETPLAMLSARDIAAAAKDVETRLTAFVMGTNDLAKDTRAKITPGRAPMLPWLMSRVARFRPRYPRRRLQRPRQCRGFRARVRRGARHGLRRQDSHPSEPDRAVQRRLFAERGRRSPGEEDHRGVRFAGKRAQGRRAARRPHGRALACRHGAPHGRNRAGD